MLTTASTDTVNLARPHDDFERWVREVRDPAKENEEPDIVIRTNKKGAEARFCLANLPSGRCAMKYSYRYDVGNCEGCGSPWTEFVDRSTAITHFGEKALAFFQKEQTCSLAESQQDVRTEMLLLLKAWEMRQVSLQEAGLPLDYQVADAILPKGERRAIEAGQLGMVF